MSTQNIGFYEEMAKLNFDYQISSDTHFICCYALFMVYLRFMAL